MTENFILQQKIDTNLCDRIYSVFKAHSSMSQGHVNKKDLGLIVDKTVKDSIEGTLNVDADLTREYKLELQKVVENYISKYPFCNFYSSWNIVEAINVQIYPPTGGYFKWHTERIGIKYGANRHLVFMTYLNDVTDAGETEFFHQNLKVKPEKGLTLIWPSDWTYTHRGVASPTQEKAIVTGWFEFTQ